MKQILSIILLALSATASAQKYKTRTLTQFKWDDSAQQQVVCIEQYNEKGKVISKTYVNSQSVVDAAEDGDDKGTKVFYTYKDSLLMSEHRYRTQEYEDTAITSYSYNDKGELVRQTVRRHDKFTTTGDAGTPVVNWKWLADTINYEYNSKGQMIAQKGGERWHKLAYNAQQLVSRDTTYFSPEELKQKTYFITVNTYTADKQLLKRVKDHYIKGQKHFNNTIQYTYVNGKAVKMHSTATSFSKNKLESAKFENMRFDKKFYYDAQGRLQKEETWDPDGFRLQTNLYTYK